MKDNSYIVNDNIKINENNISQLPFFYTFTEQNYTKLNKLTESLLLDLKDNNKRKMAFNKWPVSMYTLINTNSKITDKTNNYNNSYDDCLSDKIIESDIIISSKFEKSIMINASEGIDNLLKSNKMYMSQSNNSNLEKENINNFCKLKKFKLPLNIDSIIESKGSLGNFYNDKLKDSLTDIYLENAFKDFESIESPENKYEVDLNNIMMEENDEELLKFNENVKILNQKVSEENYLHIETEDYIEMLLSKNGLDYETINILSLQQLETIFDKISNLTLSENEITYVCNSFLNFDCLNNEMKDKIKMFLSKYLITLINKECKTTSRHLVGICNELCLKFPLIFVEVVIKELYIFNKFETGQCDLFMKLITLHFDASQCVETFRIVLSEKNIQWQENFPLVVQALLNKKIQLSNEHLSDLISLIEFNSDKNIENIKFCKMIIGFLNLYGKNLMITDIQKLKQVSASNKTLLKNQLVSLLNKYIE